MSSDKDICDLYAEYAASQNSPKKAMEYNRQLYAIIFERFISGVEDRGGLICKLNCLAREGRWLACEINVNNHKGGND